jgi:hypothetical protein
MEEFLLFQDPVKIPAQDSDMISTDVHFVHFMLNSADKHMSTSGSSSPGRTWDRLSHGDVTVFRELMPSFCCLRAKNFKYQFATMRAWLAKLCNIANRIESNRLERFTWPIRDCNSSHC